MASTYAAGVDDPARFRSFRDAGAHFGLTPRQFQSGKMDWPKREASAAGSGGISHAGRAGVRRALYQAPNVLISPQPRLVRPEVLGCSCGQAPWPRQGQSGVGTQVGLGAAQDVDDGRRTTG